MRNTIQQKYLKQLKIKQSTHYNYAGKLINLTNQMIEKQILNGNRFIEQQQQCMILQNGWNNQKYNDNKVQIEQISQENRLNFIKKVQKERNSIAKKRQEWFKAEERRIKQQEIKEKEKQQIIQWKQRQQRKKSSVTKITLINQGKIQRQKQSKNRNQELKKKMKQRLLLNKMQENFEKFQSTNLQQKKQKLAQIRALHKPLRKEDFDQHYKKIQQMKQRSKSYINNKTYNKIDCYKSIWYKKVILDDKQQQDHNNNNEDMIQLLKQMKNKSNKYSEYVRTNFKPHINKNKTLELQKSQSVVNIIPKNYEQIKEIGLQYLKYSKDHVIDDENLLLKKNKKKQQENQNIQKKSINYLQQLKQKRNRYTESTKSFIQRIKGQDIDKNQKTMKILRYAEKLEKKAKNRQNLTKMSNNMDDPQLDKLYTEAISAKLSLLQQEL